MCIGIRIVIDIAIYMCCIVIYIITTRYIEMYSGSYSYIGIGGVLLLILSMVFTAVLALVLLVVALLTPIFAFILR